MKPAMHLNNILETLTVDVHKKLGEGITTPHQAFIKVAAEWLGYDDLDDDNFVCGMGDRGNDFFNITETGFDIFQVKSHQLTSTGEIHGGLFDSEGVNDLNRVVSLLLNGETKLDNKKLQKFMQSWLSTIMRRKMGTRTEPIEVNLGLILFGQGLTNPAQKEYEDFEKTLKKSFEFQGIPVSFRARKYTLEDILLSRWREQNQDWVDKENKKRDYIELFPQAQEKEKGWLYWHDSAVFYCRAIDLIRAYDNFGYQIFEPNVRAHVGKTNVNELIKESIRHDKTRREFKFLNNGVTVTCKNYESPKENRKYFRIHEPGIINGLQTVVSLHEAYNEIDSDAKLDLEKNCFVLLRLLGKNAVSDVNKVVLASNTQNPMQPRNLKSNADEQIYFEKLFAQLGWFYARKQGAWDAFSKEPKRWRTLDGFNKSQFKAGGNSPRAKYRTLDNLEVAQAWLSFIGFSDEAVHEKRYIFSNEKLYKLTFLCRTEKHGFYVDDIDSAFENSKPQAPSHMMMLAVYLARQLARKAPLTAKENYDRALNRLGLKNLELKDDFDSRLREDDQYLFEQALGAMAQLFLDSFGYMLYKSYQDNVHDIGYKLLNNGTIKILADRPPSEELVQKIRNEEIEEGDILAVAWHAFRHVIEQLLSGPWKQNFLTARSRTRFNHSKDTKSRVFKELDNLDEFMKKTQLTRSWCANIPPKKGLYGIFQRALLKN